MTDAGLNHLEQMLGEARARRQADAERYAALDWDTCMLCGAHGEDKRSLWLACFYAVYEVVPEAIDLSGVEDMDVAKRGYLIRCCKECRSRFLGMLAAWRAQCAAKRGHPMDHDGHIEEVDPERNIPVRECGAIRWLTRVEWDERARQERQGRDETSQADDI